MSLTYLMMTRMMMTVVMRMTKGMMRMKSWLLCESNVPQLLDLAPNEAGNLDEVYERYFLPGQEKEEDIFGTFISSHS